MTKDADIAVRVGADIDPLRRDLKRGSNEFKKFGNVVSKGAKTVTTYGAALTALATTGLALVAKETAQAAREIQNLSFVANANAQQFQRMAFAAKSVNIEQEKLADILKDVNDRVGDFVATGGGPMADFFEKIAPKIGVTIEQFKKLSGPEALQLYYNSLEKANLSQQDMTFFLEAMASDATALIPLLRENGRGFQELGEKADRFNVVLSKADIEKLTKGEQAFNDMGSAIKGAATQITMVFLPEIEKVKTVVIDISSKFTEIIKKIRESREQAKRQAEAEAQINELIGKRTRQRGQSITQVETEAEEINKLLRNQEALQKLIDSPPKGRRGRAISQEEIDKQLEFHKKTFEANEKRIAQLRAESEEAQKVFDIRTSTLKQEIQPEEEKADEKPSVLGVGKDITAELDSIKAKYLTKEELDRQHRENMAIIGEEFNAANFESEEQWRKIKEQAEQDHQNRIIELNKKSMTEIEKFRAKSFQNQVKQVTGSLVQMTAGVAQHSRKMFEINKAAGIANAIVNTAEGVTKALSAYPPPISFAMAAAQSAAGLAQISAIRSQSFNGGGGGRAPSSSATEATGVTSVGGGQASTPEEVTKVHLANIDPNGLISGRQVITMINEAVENGAELRTA